jgi:hypothetical protein
LATYISSLTIHVERTRTDLSWASCPFLLLWEFANLFESVSYQSGNMPTSYISLPLATCEFRHLITRILYAGTLTS